MFISSIVKIVALNEQLVNVVAGGRSIWSDKLEKEGETINIPFISC